MALITSCHRSSTVSMCLLFLRASLYCERAYGIRDSKEAASSYKCNGQICDGYVQSLGTENACALDECEGCTQCSDEEEQLTFTATTGACAGLKLEKQHQLYCGKHAANAVLFNLHMDATSKAELDQVSQDIGAPAAKNGDYDIAAILTVFTNRGMEVQQVGELEDKPKKVSDLIANVGLIDEKEFVGLTEEEHEALKRQRRHVSIAGLQWLICNVQSYHWKTYFKKSNTWCDLDSMKAKDPIEEVDDVALGDVE